MEQFVTCPRANKMRLKAYGFAGPGGHFPPYLARSGCGQRATGGVLELRECSVGASPTEDDGSHGVHDAHDYVDERAQVQATHGECEDLRREEGESLLLWTRELEMAMGSALLKAEQQRVALAISKLGERAREWAPACGTSVETSFPTWEQLKQQLSRVFASPNQAYRVHSRFLATRQDKKELVDYAQELRTLIAGMVVDPLPEAVTVTVFMEGLQTGVARTEVSHTHPTSFEEAVTVALNAEFNFKSSRLGWRAHGIKPGCGASTHAFVRRRGHPVDARNQTGLMVHRFVVQPGCTRARKHFRCGTFVTVRFACKRRLPEPTRLFFLDA
ncbi:unnamed protein product [Phytophthora fragariaefolia]|uniref:Unnamed protein product n=1 Tax=Phytophthora fragariaefolia TaxID=1490495 RepID=A0A9W6Y6X2_9STRA|nr:unnamed protein product [Phytophthora fragariaefolia]